MQRSRSAAIPHFAIHSAPAHDARAQSHLTPKPYSVPRRQPPPVIRRLQIVTSVPRSLSLRPVASGSSEPSASPSSRSSSCSRIPPANRISRPSGPPTRVIARASPAQASAPVVASVSGASRLDRVLAAPARVSRERLVPLADRHRHDVGRDARARSSPARAATPATSGPPRRSPCAMPSRAGRRGIDLHPAAPHRRRERVGHLLQPRQVRQRSVEELRTTDTAGSGTDTAAASPSNCGSVNGKRCERTHRPRCALSMTAAIRRQRAPPSALLLRVGPGVGLGARRGQRRERGGKHLLEGLPRQIQRARSRRPISSSTSGIARVSCSGFITGGATLATACDRARFGHARRPTIRGTSDRAESDPRARSSRRGSCRSSTMNGTLLERLANPPRLRRGEHRDSRRRSAAPAATSGTRLEHAGRELLERRPLLGAIGGRLGGGVRRRAAA